MFRRVCLETPYSRDIPRNLRYLRACMRDCLNRAESPYASHGLLTQPGVLRDEVQDERILGMQAGVEWKLGADATVVYTDLGITRGMQTGIEAAEELGQVVEYRQLEGWDELERATAADLRGILAQLGAEELRAVKWIAERMLMGQQTIGVLDLARDTRDWRAERRAELADSIVYSAFDAIKREMAGEAPR